MDRRVILAVVLCVLVLMVHILWVGRKAQPEASQIPKTGAEATTGEAKGKEAGEVTEAPVAGGATLAEPKTSSEVKPAPTPTVTPTTEEGPAPEVRNDLVLENDWLHTEWTNNATGACTLIRFSKEFYANTEKAPLDLLGAYPEVIVGDGLRRRPMVLDLSLVKPVIDLSTLPFKVVEADGQKLVFAGTISDANGKLLYMTKTVRMPADKFEIEMEVQFTNVSKEKLSFQYDVGAAEAIEVEDPKSPSVNMRTARWGARGAYAFVTRPAGKFEKTPLWVEPPEAEQSGDPSIVWAGLENKYFAMLLVGEPPKGDNPGQLMLQGMGRAIQVPVPGVEKPVMGVSVRMVSPTIELEPGQTSSVQKFIEFTGPKRKDITDAYQGYGFEQLHYTGWFAFVATPLMFLLYWFYAVTKNYGVAIILLTILIRVCLHPLTKKGQVSMYKMQKLQPKIRELQTKYKGDKQKLGAEQMKLMREGGANPVSGCLPMLVQIPILIGLYQGLNAAFELRQAPFTLWMKDLSTPETLVSIGGFPIHVLPIVMAVAMFIQQGMTPKSPDPQTQQQMKIMKFMPFLFAFMFYSLPSGLCLYWFVSTLLGMVDQYIINRHLKLHEMEVNESAS